MLTNKTTLGPRGVMFLGLAPVPNYAVALGVGGAVVGGVVGGFVGKKVGWIAGTIGGALGLGLLAYFYFSGKLTEAPAMTWQAPPPVVTNPAS